MSDKFCCCSCSYYEAALLPLLLFHLLLSSLHLAADGYEGNNALALSRILGDMYAKETMLPKLITPKRKTQKQEEERERETKT